MTAEPGHEQWITDLLRTTLDEAARSAGHAAHLAADPAGVCIPEFNALPYASVDHRPVQPLQEPLRIEPDLPAALAHVVVHADGTEALIDSDLLAHHRECGAESCSGAWINARSRRRNFPARTYVLAPGHLLHSDRPQSAAILRTIESFIANRRVLARSGWDPDELDRMLRAYEVSAATATALKAGRVPDVPPLLASSFEHPFI